jgi:acyl-coenzyme A thioesterase PaaI-like protein
LDNEVDQELAARLRRAVLDMPAAQFYGLQIGRIARGEIEFLLPFRRELSFDGIHFQGSIVGAVADFAGASATMTLLPPGTRIATLDYTVKIIAQAKGGRLRGCGRVTGPGKTVSVSLVEIYADSEAGSTLCANALVSTRIFITERQP